MLYDNQAQENKNISEIGSITRPSVFSARTRTGI